MTRPGRLPRIPRPQEHGHRATIGPNAVTACRDAHQSDAHAGDRDPLCGVCIRYSAAQILAITLDTRAKEQHR